jgi:hypothetical protein
MAIDARGLSYDIDDGRVSYDLLYNESTGDFSMPKAPELIIACHNAAPDVFFDSASDYDPIEFDYSLLIPSYGDQIFFNLPDVKDFIVLSQAIAGDCLAAMSIFVKNSEWLLENGFWNDNGIWKDGSTWNDA